MLNRPVIATYVAMADDDTVAVQDLGASPSELRHNVDMLRDVSLIDHDASPEMDLSNTWS